MNNLLRKIKALAVPAIAGTLLLAGVASAHVTVSPSQSSTGAWETYTLKVPSEKESATVQVDLRIPAGASFKQYEPVPGWEVTVEGNKVSWKATGEGIGPGQFQRFVFTAQNPDEAGPIAWNAYQHYADGSLAQWSGESGSDTPHSVTEIEQAAADAGGHGHGAAADSEASGADEHAGMTAEEHAAMNADEDGSGSAGVTETITLVLSILAFGLSVFALLRGRQS